MRELIERLNHMASPEFANLAPEWQAAAREAAALARRVEDAALVEIDASGDQVQLVAEGGPLDRAATCATVFALNKQRVRLVPDAGQGGGRADPA